MDKFIQYRKKYKNKTTFSIDEYDKDIRSINNETYLTITSDTTDIKTINNNNGIKKYANNIFTIDTNNVKMLKYILDSLDIKKSNKFYYFFTIKKSYETRHRGFIEIYKTYLEKLFGKKYESEGILTKSRKVNVEDYENINKYYGITYNNNIFDLGIKDFKEIDKISEKIKDNVPDLSEKNTIYIHYIIGIIVIIFMIAFTIFLVTFSILISLTFIFQLYDKDRKNKSLWSRVVFSVGASGYYPMYFLIRKFF